MTASMDWAFLRLTKKKVRHVTKKVHILLLSLKVLALFYVGHLTKRILHRGGQKRPPYLTPKPKVINNTKFGIWVDVRQNFLKILYLNYWRHHIVTSEVYFRKLT